MTAWVGRKDRHQRLRLVPYQEAPEPPATPAVREACEKAIHVITTDGRVLRAGRASMFILEAIGWRWVRVLTWPPFIWAVEIGYAVVANHQRHLPRWIPGRRCVRSTTMSRIDDELKEAIAESEAAESDAAADVPAGVVTRAEEPPKRNIGLLIGLVAAGAAVLALVMTTFDKGAIYSKDVDAVIARCMAADPMQRYESAAQIKDAISALAKAEETPVEELASEVADRVDDDLGIDVEVDLSSMGVTEPGANFKEPVPTFSPGNSSAPPPPKHAV